MQDCSRRHAAVFLSASGPPCAHGWEIKRVVEPGRFQVLVGGSSEEVKPVGLEVVRP